MITSIALGIILGGVGLFLVLKHWDLVKKIALRLVGLAIIGVLVFIGMIQKEKADIAERREKHKIAYNQIIVEGKKCRDNEIEIKKYLCNEYDIKPCMYYQDTLSDDTQMISDIDIFYSVIEESCMVSYLLNKEMEDVEGKLSNYGFSTAMTVLELEKRPYGGEIYKEYVFGQYSYDGYNSRIEYYKSNPYNY